MLLWQNPIESGLTQVSQTYTNIYLRVIEFLPDIAAALFVLLFTWLLARFTRAAINSAMLRTKAEADIRFLVMRSGNALMWLIGFSVMLSVLRVNMAGIFATLGITGAAIGFALRDIIANFVAGIVLLSIHPFKIGDTIAIDKYEGAVERIEIRATVLRTADDKEVSIPNAIVFSSTIVKNTPLHTRRIAFSIGLDYEVAYERAQEIILTAISSVAGIADTPPPGISISGFSAYVVNLDIYCWAKDDADYSAAASEVKLRIKEALQNAHIGVAPATSMTLVQAGHAIEPG